MTVSVRWARAADLAGTRHLSVRWMTSQKIEGREVVIAEEGGRIIGALRFVRVWDRAPLVCTWWWTRPERGPGVGSALVSFLANELSGERGDAPLRPKSDYLTRSMRSTPRRAPSPATRGFRAARADAGSSDGQ